jgi:hypothetical protein
MARICTNTVRNGKTVAIISFAPMSASRSYLTHYKTAVCSSPSVAIDRQMVTLKLLAANGAKVKSEYRTER